MSIANVADVPSGYPSTQVAGASASAAGDGFSELMAGLLEEKEVMPPLSPAEEAKRKERERLEALLNGLLAGPDATYAGRSIEEVGEGIEEGFQALGDDMAALADKHGIDFVSVNQQFMLIRVPGPLDTSKYIVDGPGGTKIFHGGAYMEDLNRLKAQGGFDEKVEKGKQQVRDFLAEYREMQKNWNEEVANLAARVALVKAAAEIPGFEEAYRNDPKRAIGENLGFFKSQIDNTNVRYQDGAVSWSY